MMENKRKLIGFSGPAGSGKTTAAMFTDGRILSFAEPLKACIQDLFKFTDEQLFTLGGKEAVDLRYGVSPRVVMQKFGTEFIRETVPDLWLILMHRKLETLPTNVLAVIDDVRFEDEAELIRSCGGVIVHIKGRQMALSSHASEQPLQVGVNDFIIYNTQTLENLETTVNNITNSALRGVLV
jgi:hypothetical protein